mmetsp:Transcript_12821/g.20880  ORF Transcript_12821/g.20880 Transcript_12821/m.20880 type:complete len:253 (+) Transcript_12821:372-1130(+)
MNLMNNNFSGSATENNVQIAAACALLLGTDAQMLVAAAPSAVDKLLELLENHASKVPMPIALVATSLATVNIQNQVTQARQRRALELATKLCTPGSLHEDQQIWRPQLIAATRVLHDEMLPSRKSTLMGRYCSRIMHAESTLRRVAMISAVVLGFLLAMFALWVVVSSVSSYVSNEGPRSLRDDAHKFLPVVLLIAYVSVGYKSSNTMPKTTADKIIAPLARNVVEAHAIGEAKMMHDEAFSSGASTSSDTL